MIGDLGGRSRFLVRAARFLPSAIRDDLVEHSLGLAPELSKTECADLLNDVVHVVSRRTIRPAAALAAEIGDSDLRTTLICEMSAGLDETERAALTSALLQGAPTNLSDEFADVVVGPLSLSALTPYVTEAEIPHLLARVGELEGWSVERLFRGLKGKINSATTFRAALDAANSFDGDDWLMARIGLIAASDTAGRMFSDDVLTSIRGMTNKDLAAVFLEAASTAVPEERVSGLVALVSDAGSDVDRSELRQLGARLPVADAAVFIAKVRELLSHNEFFMAAPLVAIAGRLDDSERHALAEEAWSYIREATYVRDRVGASIALSAALDDAAKNMLWEETLAFLETQKRESHFEPLGAVSFPYLEGFLLLAEKGPDTLLSKCLKAVEKQSYSSYSTRLLEAVGRRWSELTSVTGCNAAAALDHLLRYLSVQGRAAVLTGMAPFLRELHKLAGREEINHMTWSVQQTAEWWP